MKRKIGILWEYLRFGVEFFVLRHDRPYILGLVSNDTCNLHCPGCRVANVYHSNMSFAQVATVLDKYYRKGVRFLYVEGGEPYLWHDGKLRLKDIVKLAHDMGYLRVHIYTNGTIPMHADPDFTWISIDGPAEIFETIRGIPLERVMRNARRIRGKHAVIFVVNTVNYLAIRAFLEYLHRELPDTPVLFYFHTPYYGVDELLLSHAQRKIAVNTILNCKRDGLPILNSRGALAAYLSGNNGLPVNYWWVVDQDGEHRCCRVDGNPEICKDCGYSTCLEIMQARAWRPAALWGMLRAF